MLSLPHLIIIFLIALMVFGPEKLPELARKMGHYMAEFRRMTGDVRRVMDEEMREIERQTRENEARKREAAVAAAQGLPLTQSPAPLPASAAAPGSAAPDGTVASDRPTNVEPVTVTPTIGKPQALAMEPAPESEIDQDYSHVKHNPS
jgi:sec-independent protein translocase protein TatB